MIALKVTNVKQFMGKLLTAEDFDAFLLEKASIHSFNAFTIDGRENRAFYTEEEWTDPEIRPYEFSSWKKLKPVCYFLIKGKRTPTAFHFALLLPPNQAAAALSRGDLCDENLVKSFVLNIKYDGASLLLITGASYHDFVMDREPEALWDQALKQFLDQRNIDYEEM